MNIEPPTIEEIIKSIRALSNCKVQGIDNIQAEVLKADVAKIAKVFCHLFTKIWNREEIPTDWQKGIIIKLSKKGNLEECDNWRGITSLSVPGKVLCRIIINRIRDAIDIILRKEQAGFRRGRGCINQIFILRNIVEQCIEWNSPLFINFIDFKRAFDTIHRETLKKIMANYGIPGKIIRMVQAFYDHFSCVVEHEGKHSEWFHIKSGVRQGCVMSGFLFLLVIDWTMKQTTRKRCDINWGRLGVLEDLDFADDIALLSATRTQLQAKTDDIQKIAETTGLEINKKKSKIMCVKANNIQPITLDNEEIEMVDSFTYLGAVIDTSDNATADIRNRIKKRQEQHTTS